jgi:hypothetical protein
VGFCPACRKHWEEPPGACRLDEHLEYWRIEAEQQRRENRNLNKVLQAALERARQLQASYAAARCPKCGTSVQVVSVGPP